MSTRNHGLWWGLVGALLTASLVLAVGWGRPQELTSLDDDLTGAAAAALAGDGLLDLRDVTDVDWDQLGLFLPYSGSEAVQRELGVRMPAAADRKMNSESDEFLAFVRDGNLVAWAVIGRGRISVLAPPGTYEAEDAVFAVESPDEGLNFWLGLGPAGDRG